MKKISFFIDSLGGGGAERVVSLLCREFSERGYETDIIMLKKQPVSYELPESVRLVYAEDMPVTKKSRQLVKRVLEKCLYFRVRYFNPLLRRLGCKDYLRVNETGIYFYSAYALAYREYLEKNRDRTAIGFLIRSNIALLMAANGTGVKTVFCERNNPVRPDMPKNILKLRDRLYSRCDAAVFQTEEQRRYYTKLGCPAAVIPNPLKEGLPSVFEGERRREIVNFCRLNKQKNIPLLIEAFEMLLKEHPDYTLRIFGRGEEKEKLIELVYSKRLENSVFFEDFTDDVHERVRDAAMFVCTSDYEGMSNSMLEAMAIGLPCVCTDCAGGGAGMMINSGENGILVPAGDREAVFAAMKEIIENLDLAKKLSEKAADIRARLDISEIADRWEEII